MNNKNETNYEFEPQKLKSRKGVITFVIVFLAIFLIGICFITIKYLLPKDNDINQDNNQSANSYKLDIYGSSSGSYCIEKDNYCDEVAFTIKTETQDAKALDVNDKALLYKDNGIKLYDIKTKEIKKIDLEDTYTNYKILEDKDYNPMGITYQEQNSDYVSYYNINTNKKMYENKYTKITDDYYGSGEDYLYAEIFKDSKLQAFLLNNDEEKIEFETAVEEAEKYDWYMSKNFSFYKVKDKYFYEVFPPGDSLSTLKLYSNKKQILAENIDYVHFQFYEDYLYIVDNNNLKKYDVDGNVITTINVSKDKVKQIINNYLIYVDDNNYLSIMNIDNQKENKQVVKWDENKYTYDDFSTYYTKEDLERLDKDGEEGLYLLIYYKDGKNSDGNYGIEYYYNTNKEIKEYPIDHEMEGRYKPVLYLYPIKETKVKVEFVHPEYLTTTYPKYQDKWEVVAKPNGDLYDKDNKYYYALYWDEVRYHEVDFKEGFYVTKDNAINFLEDKLNIIGLNSREANEFIMYFLPILENNEKSLVYFELTKEREEYNKLIITPKPDSLLRVTIHIKKVDKETSIKEEKIETFKRVGFSAVEWGGMLY